jgi:cysteine desulfurase
MPTRPLIYLDCNATTPTTPRVQAAVIAAMQQCGNASSAHNAGRAAAERIATARASVASLLGAADPADVTFTSGATEANNLAVMGAIAGAKARGLAKPHVLAGAAEHSSILAPLKRAAARGEIDFDLIPVRDGGAVRVECVERRLRPQTVMVALQGANNEVGTINPLDAVGELCGRRGVLLHADLCQSYGRVPFDLASLDSAAMSAHKLYGPTGVGALYARPRVWEFLDPQTLGGGQEQGRRAGTINAHAIAGFGAACDEMAERWARGPVPEAARLRYLRDLLLARLQSGLGGRVRVNGAIDPPCWDEGAAPERLVRLPHNLNVTLVGVDSAGFHADARQRVCVSAGSACKALGGQRSHVLEALGAPDDGAIVRVGLGSCNDAEQVEEAARVLVKCARRNMVR